jgi:hypothetical protein
MASAGSEPQALQCKRKLRPTIRWVGFGALNVIFSEFCKSITRSVDNIHAPVHLLLPIRPGGHPTGAPGDLKGMEGVRLRSPPNSKGVSWRVSLARSGTSVEH